MVDYRRHSDNELIHIWRAIEFYIRARLPAITIALLLIMCTVLVGLLNFMPENQLLISYDAIKFLILLVIALILIMVYRQWDSDYHMKNKFMNSSPQDRVRQLARNTPDGADALYNKLRGYDPQYKYMQPVQRRQKSWDQSPGYKYRAPYTLRSTPQTNSLNKYSNNNTYRTPSYAQKRDLPNTPYSQIPKRIDFEQDNRRTRQQHTLPPTRYPPPLHQQGSHHPSPSHPSASPTSPRLTSRTYRSPPPQTDLSHLDNPEKASHRAESTFKKLGIQQKGGYWMESAKNWLSRHFLPKLIQEHYANLDALNSVLSHVDKYLENGEVGYGGGSGKKAISIQQLVEFVGRDPNLEGLFAGSGVGYYGGMHGMQLTIRETLKESIRHRINIERFFHVQNFSPQIREYTIMRLNQLNNSFHREYMNDCGADYLGQPWTPRYPTDAEVISTVFFTMLTNVAFNKNSDPTSEIGYLVRNFVAYYPHTPPNNCKKTDVWFHRTNSPNQETHFNVQSGNEMCYAPKGVNNFFFAMILFCWHLRNHTQGYLGQQDFTDLIDSILTS